MSSIKPKLLLVEDDLKLIPLILKHLKETYNVDYVLEGNEAIKKCSENNYDAFLIDIVLPGDLNGIQTAKKIRELKNNNNKPYFAVTGLDLPGDKELFLSVGFTHHIAKPINFPELLKLIELVLKSPR
jgi:DNA-binding response OmpR family regulator